jgi:hypothetical protein
VARKRRAEKLMHERIRPNRRDAAGLEVRSNEIYPAPVDGGIGGRYQVWIRRSILIHLSPMDTAIIAPENRAIEPHGNSGLTRKGHVI